MEAKNHHSCYAEIYSLISTMTLLFKKVKIIALDLILHNVSDSCYTISHTSREILRNSKRRQSFGCAYTIFAAYGKFDAATAKISLLTILRSAK